MKKMVIVLMLLGVITLEARPKYRIESWVYNGSTYYLPQQRVWYKTNYFYLPFKVWKSGDYPFLYKSQAQDIIQNWKNDYQEKMDYKKSRYYTEE
jgi:hypothetical protein